MFRSYDNIQAEIYFLETTDPLFLESSSQKIKVPDSSEMLVSVTSHPGRL
jgi:hypothetical protein